MHRFYLPPSECQPDSLTLPEREAHHASAVLRLTAGDTVTVLDGAGTELRCEITAADRRAVTLRVCERLSHPAPLCEITLRQAVPKGRTMEDIIEKAVELGARRIVPLLTERTVVKLDALEAEAKREKWQLGAIEALKQCGAAWLPEVATPATLATLLKDPPPVELALVGSLQPERRHPRECFAEFRARHGRAPRSVALWVGPEGDFTRDEVAAICASGAQPITLGALVLRCDTAAAYCLAMAGYEANA